MRRECKEKKTNEERKKTRTKDVEEIREEFEDEKADAPIGLGSLKVLITSDCSARVFNSGSLLLTILFVFIPFVNCSFSFNLKMLLISQVQFLLILLRNCTARFMYVS
jgi:hypothetical protein